MNREVWGNRATVGGVVMEQSRGSGDGASSQTTFSASQDQFRLRNNILHTYNIHNYAVLHSITINIIKICEFSG